MDLILFGLLAWFSGDAIGDLFGAAGAAAQAKAAEKFARAQMEHERLRASKLQPSTD